jgi:hypothetical protein
MTDLSPIDRLGATRAAGRCRANVRATAAPLLAPFPKDKALDERRIDEIVGQLRQSSRERRRVFSNRIFASPGWDMLLDMFVAWRDDRPLSVKAACLAAGVPKSTALRYLDQLCDDGIVLKLRHKKDHRSFTVSLSATGLELILAYLERLGEPAVLAAPEARSIRAAA